MAEAGRRGVIITDGADRMTGLVEKPDPDQADGLVPCHFSV
jgi:hypothetical protein